MGEAGDADELLHGGGPRFHEHAAHEARAEFRDAQRAGFPHDLLLGDAQGLGAGKQAHNLSVVQGDIAEVDAGELLQPVHHGRVVVAQAVELDQNVVHGVEVVVGGDGGALHVVGGVLDGGKLADVVLLGQHHDAAGVLARGALDAHAARRQSFLVRAARMDAALLQILGGKAVGRLFRKAGNGAGAVDVALAEKLLDVGMGARLILAGEVEVDVGHLVALEAEEHLEGDVKAVLGQLVAADLAVFVRQVHAHAGQLRGGEEHLVAVVAAVVRRQGVDLGDAAHGGHEAGANAAAAAHEVSVRERLADQLLRDGIQGGKAVADDGAQLLFQPLLDDFGQGIAVELLGAAPGAAFDVAGRLLPIGLEGVLALRVLGEEAELAHLVRDLARGVDDHLVRLFFSKVAELLQHLVRGFEVQGRLVVAVVVAQTCLQNGAVDGVLGVEKMHVPGGDHGLVQLFAQGDDFAVEFPQVLLVAGSAGAEHEAVVADGLDLQIVVPAGDALDLLLRPVVDDGLKQLARLACAAQNQALAVLVDEVAGHAGMAVEIAQVAVGDEVVEVLHALLAGAQQNDVVALPDGIAADDGVDILEGRGALFPGCVIHARKTLCRSRRVVYGPVRVLERYAQQPAYRAQLVALLLGVELAREGERIQHRRVEAHAHALALGLKHAHVKGRVVRGHGAVPDEVQELAHALGGAFLAAEHEVGDTCDFADFGL